jgi:threonine dehydrogenase-like Zn-dependent dehydrogenase
MAEFIRQQSLVNQAKLSNLRVCIVGAGSIGSFTALALTKMGIQHLALWDRDVVELHNISNQFYTRDAIDTPKVIAVLNECKRYTPSEIDIECFNNFYDGQGMERYDVVIALTDNIEGRKAAFEASQKSPKTQLFVDGRMGAELFRSFAFNPHDSTLSTEYFNDYIDGVVNEELPCTARSIIYNVAFAASVITSFVKKFVCDQKMPFQFIFDFSTYKMSKSKME